MIIVGNKRFYSAKPENSKHEFGVAEKKKKKQDKTIAVDCSRSEDNNIIALCL